MLFDDIKKINQYNLVDYWLAHNLTEKDFYCRDCGKLMIDLNELADIRYNPDSVRETYRVYIIRDGVYKQYVENDQNRWLVRGRNLSGKIFFRKICWECFFKHLPQIEDISKRARKSSWYRDILSGNYRPPATWTSPSKYFKLLFDISDEDLNKERKKFDTASKESFIRRFGEKRGLKAFDEYRARQAYTCSKEYMMREHGMTEDEWKQYNANRAVTLDNLIKRHGFDIGQQMWKSYCERQAYAGCKLDYFKEKYGNEEGEKKYNDLIKRKRLTYDNFIRKYGENDGALKWIAYIQKISKTYSAVSQELFRLIDEKYNIARINSHYASKDGTETTLHVPVNGEMKLISLDFTLFNKAIEFYGDFYHANPAKYNASDKIFAKTAADIWEYNNSRVEAVKSAGYDVMIVWEGDFYRNPSEVINKCLKFLKD